MGTELLTKKNIKKGLSLKWAVKVRHFYGFYYVQIKQKTKT
ncbi:hypothetical protein DBQ04_09020 [Lactobacillus acidophilus]|nr:hypothetical protein LA14_1943 [Lactobacillus acidophilus La-14]KAB1964224.1 hypothetical protein F8247_08780 [Lactobacillus acidophilus]MBO8212526.1 hypothetical protein [Lactobacillus acidophilus]MCT3593855.1 hypothetical protein [Lactobacillus acidophilus]MCT3604500.1 hypothetical protein [Lactobacillus acidophilus]